MMFIEVDYNFENPIDILKFYLKYNFEHCIVPWAHLSEVYWGQYFSTDGVLTLAKRSRL